MDVKSEAQAILDKFGKDLENIKVDNNYSIRKGVSYREEKKGETADVEFKIIMFKNSPYKDDSYLILEKGSWN